MENLQEIKGFITFVDEEKKEKRELENEEEENKEGEEHKSIQQLKAEAGEKILNAQGEDIVEKFSDKVLKEFMPCMLLSQHDGDQFLEYQDFDQCMDEFFSQAEKYKERNKLETKENQIWNKMDRIKDDQ